MASLLVGAPPMASKSFTAFPSISFPKSGFLTSIPFSLSASATSLSTAVSTPPRPLIYCGRGDRKTARGKRFSHSFGNARPKNKNKGRGPPRVYAPPLPPRKDKYDDGEVVKIEIDESLFSN